MRDRQTGEFAEIRSVGRALDLLEIMRPARPLGSASAMPRRVSDCSGDRFPSYVDLDYARLCQPHA